MLCGPAPALHSTRQPKLKRLDSCKGHQCTDALQLVLFYGRLWHQCPTAGNARARCAYFLGTILVAHDLDDEECKPEAEDVHLGSCAEMVHERSVAETASGSQILADAHH